MFAPSVPCHLALLSMMPAKQPLHLNQSECDTSFKPADCKLSVHVQFAHGNMSASASLSTFCDQKIDDATSNTQRGAASRSHQSPPWPKSFPTKDTTRRCHQPRQKRVKAVKCCDDTVFLLHRRTPRTDKTTIFQQECVRCQRLLRGTERIMPNKT